MVHTFKHIFCHKTAIRQAEEQDQDSSDGPELPVLQGSKEQSSSGKTTSLLAPLQLGPLFQAPLQSLSQHKSSVHTHALTHTNLLIFPLPLLPVAPVTLYWYLLVHCNGELIMTWTKWEDPSISHRGSQPWLLCSSTYLVQTPLHSLLLLPLI